MDSIGSKRYSSRVWGVIVMLCLVGGCQPLPETTTGRNGRIDDGRANGTPFALDGRFDDWDRDQVAAHDADYFYVRLRFERARLLQETPRRLIIHGRDGRHRVAYDFGRGKGVVSPAPGQITEIGHDDLRLVKAPTVAAREFELAIDRHAPSFPQTDCVDWLVAPIDDAASRRQGRAEPARPADLPAGASRYCFDSSATRPQSTSRSLPPKTPQALRLVSWNVEKDKIVADPSVAIYERLLATLDADLWVFQELYESDANAVRSVVVAAMGGRWYAEKTGRDLVVVSRYPIRASRCVAFCDDFGSVGAYWLDTEPVFGTATVVVNAHPPCCTGRDPDRDRLRQQAVDETIAFLREARQGRIDDFPMKASTALIVAGDMNFVGSPAQLATLRSGAIHDVATYGPAFAPDGDGTALLDSWPQHLSGPYFYTWRHDASRFAPGRLDFVLYGDAVLDAVEAFVFDTSALAPTDLEPFDLQATDTATASDHHPVVVDFRARQSTAP
ncbi:MAG: endonuclease/exonuclease/phosphatase family protein [Acidobacteriota bacterium]